MQRIYHTRYIDSVVTQFKHHSDDYIFSLASQNGRGYYKDEETKRRIG